MGFDSLLSTLCELAKAVRDQPVIIAISGFGGSGKSTLAKQLLMQLDKAALVCIDDFVTDRLSLRGVDWPGFDRDRLRREVLIPARAGQALHYGVYDWQIDAVRDFRTIIPQRWLLVEGCSLLHPDLLPEYDYKIWLDVPLDIATAQGVARDAGDAVWSARWRDLWAPNEQDFFDKYRPDLVADFIYEPSQVL